MTKFFTQIMIYLLLAGITNHLTAQDVKTAEITRLENLEREAVIKGDSTLLFNTLWSPQMVINNPAWTAQRCL